MENKQEYSYIACEDLRAAAMRAFAQADGEEEIALRQENIKHFDLGQGRHQAIVYGEPVHYDVKHCINLFMMRQIQSLFKYLITELRIIL